MSERELFIKLIPSITELIVEVKKMSRERYEEFKKEYLTECEQHTPEGLEFAKKILIVVDTYLEDYKE